MPSAALPAAATSHMSPTAFGRLSDNIDHLPFETYTQLYYSDYATHEELGYLVEYDATHWAERTGGTVYYYEELSETRDQAVIYDASRDVTIVIDYDDYNVSITDPAGQADYLLDDIALRPTPFAPPFIFP